MPDKLESVLQYLEDYLEVAAHPDYPGALNGLQVQGPDGVERVCAAVDASEEAVRAAVDEGADLLLVHHGLFWGGVTPVTGPLYRKLRALLGSGTGLYSVHLPLDAHPEVGNCALLARAMGVDVEERFGEHDGAPLGWKGTVACGRDELVERVSRAVGGGPVHLIPGGGERVETVGVVTGGAGSMIPAAAAAGLDAFVTGEGAHHTHAQAMELGLNVLYAGHYATETFGVKALAAHLAERFDLEWSFLDFPSGL